MEKLEFIKAKSKETKKQVESLPGSLNFMSRAIPIGRAFLRRTIDATCGLKRPHHKIRVTQSMKEDLHIWLEFLKHHNGTSLFLDRFWTSSLSLQLYTDSACGESGGFRAFFHGSWTRGSWPNHWHERGLTKNITLLEFIPNFCSS